MINLTNGHTAIDVLLVEHRAEVTAKDKSG